MKLLKTSLFSGIITLIRIGSGFIAGKFVALFTGAAGVALLGGFTNFITIVLTLANGAINAGIVKYTAEYKEDEEKIKSLFSSALRVSIYSSLIVGVGLIIFSKYLSTWIFTIDDYYDVIIVLGATIIFYSLNTFLISILNGLGEIKTYTIVNTIGTLVGLILTVIFVYYFRIRGALYSLVLAQSVVFFVTLGLVIKSNWFRIEFFTGNLDRILLKKLSHFSLMAIVTAICLPLAQIILRSYIIEKLGVSAAGFWQGMMRISDGYLLLIVTSLSTYYMPKLSSLKTKSELRHEIWSGYKIILPAVALGCVIIFFCRLFIIKLLFTPDFITMKDLFFWQLVGDFFKMAAWKV